MTDKHRLTVVDDEGNHIRAVYVTDLGTDYENADLSGLWLLGQHNLSGKCFHQATLYWADLSESNLNYCDLYKADLRGAVLRGTLLRGADLREANLGTDNLGGFTDLHGADLSEALLEGAKLEGAVYDSQTQFPKGFDPKEAGMVFDEI